MKEMKVGDIGVLQNIILDPNANGNIVEIVGGLKVREAYHPQCGEWCGLCYLVKDYNDRNPMAGDGRGWRIESHQIRPISDPDATQSIDEQETIEA